MFQDGNEMLFHAVFEMFEPCIAFTYFKFADERRILIR